MNLKTGNYLYFDASSSDNTNGKGREGSKLTEVVYQFKLILLGDIAVGKSSILRRFVEDEFSSEYLCTVGMGFRIKTIRLDGNITVALKIWDTCGEEKFRGVTRQYYKDSDGVILIFDLTNSMSFMALCTWLKDVEVNGPKDITIVLIGNKKDLVTFREVTKEEIEKFLMEYNNVIYYECSAVNGENVNEMFTKLAEVLMEKSRVEEKDEENNETTKKMITLRNSVKDLGKVKEKCKC